MFEYNDYFDAPAQITYVYIGECQERKGIAFQESIIDLATGEAIDINNEIDILHISSDWSAYFMD